MEEVGREESSIKAVMLYPYEVAELMKVSRWTVYC